MKTNTQKHKHHEYVFLSFSEHRKLVERFGGKETEEAIQNLNDYIGSRGFQRKYKSHYHTILTWKRKDEKKKALSFNLPKEKSVQVRQAKPETAEVKKIRHELIEANQRIVKENSFRNPENRALLNKLQTRLNEAKNGAVKLNEYIKKDRSD